MSISLLLEMAASSDPDRTAVVSGDMRLTTANSARLPTAEPASSRHPARSTSPTSAPAAPCCRCCCSPSARAAVAVTPLNYRLSADGLRELIDRLPHPAGDRRRRYRDIVAGAGKQVISSDEFIDVGPHRRAGRRVRRPRRRRRRAVHLRHHVAAQGRRADAQQPDQLRHRHGRVRRRRRPMTRR